MPANVRIKDHWKEQRLFERRAMAAGAIIGVLALVLFARLVTLQVVRHEYYTDLSQGNRVRIEPLPAPRGLILDRNGTVLAENRPAYQLELVREEVPDLDATLRRLSEIGLIAADDIDDTRKLVRSHRSFDSVPIRLRLDDEQIATFAVHRFEFQGVDIRTRLARSYPYGELAVHALGYVGAISEQDLGRIDRAAYSGTTLIGKLGAESAYESELHGQNGSREILVNAQGRSVQRQGALVPNLITVQPVAGKDLVLAMDIEVQRVAEAELGARRGAVIAIDPANGDVIALVSRPGYDPNAFGRGISRVEYQALLDDIDRPLFNRALRGTYPSGSTIKPAIALAGLVHGEVIPTETRFCNGVFRLPGSSRMFREGRSGRHGAVALVDSIARSCDVYFYDLASRLGVDRISGFLAPFGFGSLTGIDIGGEKPGLLPSREWKRKAFSDPADQVWFPGETVNFGIGQGYFLVTPLQLAHYTSILANHGTSYKPRLVTALRDPVSGAVRQLAPQKVAAISATPEQWDIVTQGMIGAMRGRGTAAATAGRNMTYTIAGKTGTAQVFSVGQTEKYDEKTVAERLRDHSWFIAFAPAEAPRIAVAVLVENGGFGSTGAAPIARKVMDAWLLKGGGA
ncbi:MAG TPA: penicillin-binding protein 2 [Steroidobacteraceae bacterium]|nr:penicillin-binding protein 2 [Steroidobacteraceae bacterium]HNS28008.1 penicillin-binding protein 2 [Steroidobacteraceae bacterium]